MSFWQIMHPLNVAYNWSSAQRAMGHADAPTQNKDVTCGGLPVASVYVSSGYLSTTTSSILLEPWE